MARACFKHPAWCVLPRHHGQRGKFARGVDSIKDLPKVIEVINPVVGIQLRPFVALMHTAKSIIKINDTRAHTIVGLL